MKKLMFVFLASLGFAALPPMAQSVKELRALLDDPHLYSSLGGAEQIEDIIRKENGYLVLTKNYAMLVNIQYAGRDDRMVGPARFEFEFTDPIDLRFSK